MRGSRGFAHLIMGDSGQSYGSFCIKRIEILFLPHFLSLHFRIDIVW